MTRIARTWRGVTTPTLTGHISETTWNFLFCMCSFYLYHRWMLEMNFSQIWEVNHTNFQDIGWFDMEWPTWTIVLLVLLFNVLKYYSGNNFVRKFCIVKLRCKKRICIATCICIANLKCQYAVCTGTCTRVVFQGFTVVWFIIIHPHFTRKKTCVRKLGQIW